MRVGRKNIKLSLSFDTKNNVPKVASFLYEAEFDFMSCKQRGSELKLIGSFRGMSLVCLEFQADNFDLTHPELKRNYLEWHKEYKGGFSTIFQKTFDDAARAIGELLLKYPKEYDSENDKYNAWVFSLYAQQQFKQGNSTRKRPLENGDENPRKIFKPGEGHSVCDNGERVF